MQALHGILPIHGKIRIVIDALDECADLLELKLALTCLNAMPEVHLLVSSRNEATISNQLQSLCPMTIAVEESFVRLDIAHYLRRSILSHPDTQFLDGDFEQVVKLMAEKARGMYV